MSISLSGSASKMSSPFAALLRRLHFYIGLFVGPFLLVAAFSGMLYALTPQIENQLYASALHTDSRGPALSLEDQVLQAQDVIGPTLKIAAVRPAPYQGDTTRIMFREPGLGSSEHRAVFIDPVSGEVRGDIKVYGTSGILPLRTWIDQFHRSLQLGDIGRIYSELAASWLWVTALGGLLLWAQYRRKVAGGRGKGLRAFHASIGLWLLLGLLFFSATGLTWSQYAGNNIGVLRAHYGWSTPSVLTTLDKGSSMNMPMSEHADHAVHMTPAQPTSMFNAALFDQILSKARSANIDAAKVEIRPSDEPNKAWVVSEIDRSWPTQVDAVSIDPQTLAVIDKVEFDQYSLPAKLTRWGIDAHMGVLFGLVNQLILVAFASGLVVMVILGYLMWWRRRPTLARQPTLFDAWRHLGRATQGVVLVVAATLGFCLPVLGWSLLLLVICDVIVSLKVSLVSLNQDQL